MRRRHIRYSLLAACIVFAGNAWSIPAQVPLFLVQSAEPLVMINMSNDHQLFYKAYDDWSDVDEDGTVDTTYNHGIDYFGYFDSYKCYDYDATNQRFVPQAVSGNKYCNGVSGAWSGNFLNWATMTRIDTVRKILYGGARSTDSASQTVLERAYLPGDAHSFAKYFKDTGGAIGKLTPWTVSEITICNTTYAADGDSENRTEPPLIRVAAGNFSLWAANERYQCHWNNKSELQSDIFNSPNPGTNNGNDPATTGLNAAADNPDWTTNRLGDGDYVVRVEACVSGLVGTEKCKGYPSGNLKPIGLLQEYGDDGATHFGLLTGSYAKNKSGGTLRKNIGPIADEINITTDGTFKTPPSAGNIIGNLSALRISGYDHDPGYYNTSDSCSWGLGSFSNGHCTNWGNPQSEIYLESLRYLAGASSPNFNANDTAFVNNLISASSWVDPLTNNNYCAPVRIIQFNASVTSYDNDELSGTSDLAAIGSVTDWTNKVGATNGENISGNEFFIGNGTTPTTLDGICTAKTLTALSDAEGLCPEAPRLEGSFDIAGLAYYAHTTSIRTDLVDSDNNTADVKVDTYGVTLSPAVPKIEVPVPGGSGSITILPACRNESVGGNCAIVDFKVVKPHQEYPVGSGNYIGHFYVNWEDSEQGGDYDQDMAGTLSYSVNATSITVTTNVFADSTPNKMGFGYIISGTTQDGFHTHSGINYFTAYTDPTAVLTCSDAAIDCETGQPPTSVTYSVGSSTASLLKDPLWYAAKWGGFTEDEKNVNGRPDLAYEWDENGDGMPDNYFFARNPGQLNDQLASVFQAVWETSSASAVVANSVSFQSTTRIYQARFDSKKWTGQLLSFPLDVATGAVLTAEWDAGVLVSAQDYDTEREILTWDPSATGGIPFRWADLTASQQGLLHINPATATGDGLGEERLEYLRGNQYLELSAGNGGSFRNRDSLLGDNVNSSPAVVGVPNMDYVDTLESTSTTNPNNLYSTFVAANDDIDCIDPDGPGGLDPVASEREPMVYFGANDGMLHGVSACTGKEWLAYVPNAVMADLPELTSPSYNHQYFVDGAPTVVDAFWSNAWHTVLVGSLRAGGKAVFALDITDPSQFDETYASQVVLWEKSSSDTGFGDLGYTFSQPAIVKAEGHGWVAIFGNGFDSASGKAVLYIVDIDDGDLQNAIVLDNGPNNGLATVAPVDTDNDGLVDVLYAGDLQGNLWRLEAKGNQGFAANNSDSLLYRAMENSTTPQPITTRPEVGYHPTKASGRMVYFGTGKYYQSIDGDPNASGVQTMYGIYDDDSQSTITSVTNHTLSNILQRQTVTTQTSSTFGSETHDVRVLSDTAVNWYSASNTSGQHGWYLDLPDTGEKMVANPILRGGRLIFVTTIPSLASCDAGGDSWLMEVAADNGGAIDQPVFDLNGDGVFDFNDNYASGSGPSTTYSPVSGKKSKVGILQPPAIVAGVGGAGTGGYGKAEAKYSSGSKDGQIEVTIEDGGLPSAGRKSWIQFK